MNATANVGNWITVRQIGYMYNGEKYLQYKSWLCSLFTFSCVQEVNILGDVFNIWTTNKMKTYSNAYIIFFLKSAIWQESVRLIHTLINLQKNVLLTLSRFESNAKMSISWMKLYCKLTFRITFLVKMFTGYI